MVEWLVRNFSINSSKKTNEFPHLLKGFLLKKIIINSDLWPYPIRKKFSTSKESNSTFYHERRTFMRKDES